MGPAAFELFHPAVPSLLFGGIVILSMISIEPVCTAILAAGGLLFIMLTRGLREALLKLRWQLPLLILICLINPLFSATGSTLLCKLGPFYIYGDSLAFGATMGALLVGVLLWIEAMGEVLGQDELLTMTGGALPMATLAVSMTARLVPQLMRRATGIRQSMSAASASTGVSPVRLMNALTSSALEDSLERADSMRARGWGARKRRSRYRTRSFRGLDALAFFCVATMLGLASWGVYVSLGHWQFYPRMAGPGPLWAYGSLALLAALPSLVVIVGWLCDRHERAGTAVSVRDVVSSREGGRRDA